MHKLIISSPSNKQVFSINQSEVKNENELEEIINKYTDKQQNSSLVSKKGVS